MSILAKEAKEAAGQELLMDPYKFEVYDTRGPRSLAGWGGWFDGIGDKVCSWEETCRK